MGLLLCPFGFPPPLLSLALSPGCRSALPCPLPPHTLLSSRPHVSPTPSLHVSQQCLCIALCPRALVLSLGCLWAVSVSLLTWCLGLPLSLPVPDFLLLLVSDLSLSSLPAPTRLPGRRAGGQPRSPALGPRPSSRQSAAAEPAREAAPVSWHLPTSGPLPTSRGWGGGAGVPSSSRSSAAGRVGREATPRVCPRLGPGLTGRDQWALLRRAAR